MTARISFFFLTVLIANLSFPSLSLSASLELRPGFPASHLLAFASTLKAQVPTDAELTGEPGSRRKGRLLAAAGLAIISVLLLATGIALLRAFRKR